MRRALSSFLVLVCLAVSIGCASAFSVEEEIRLGERVAREVEEEMPLSKNEKWQRDIAEMGERLIPYVNRKEIPYHFRIVEAEEKINAFALPGGYVYFTERMWQIMTPAERAGIMAHEITHCDQRHGVDQMLKAKQRALWALPLIVLGGGGGLGYAVLLGNTLISQRYSRKMEREADELGIKLLDEAGFDPSGTVTAMKKLLHIQSSVNRYEISDIFASHPDTNKRIEYLAQAATSMGASASDLELRSVDDPARLGNVTGQVGRSNVLMARCSKSLEYGQKILIKKMLWDDEINALAPRTIATATVLSPGRFPYLTLDTEEGFFVVDVMIGDGIYPAPESEQAQTDARTEAAQADRDQ